MKASLYDADGQLKDEVRIRVTGVKAEAGGGVVAVFQADRLLEAEAGDMLHIEAEVDAWVEAPTPPLAVPLPNPKA